MRMLCLALCLVLVLTSLFSVSVFAAAAEYELHLSVGETLKPGRYRFVDVISIPGSESVSYSVRFPFVSNGSSFDYFSVYFSVDGVFELLFYQPGTLRPYTVSDGWNISYQTIDVYTEYVVSDQLRCDFLNTNLRLLYRFGSGGGLSHDLLTLFSSVSDGLIALLSTVTALFWVDGSLTFFGVLSLVALAISVSLLLFYILSRFLKLRG